MKIKEYIPSIKATYQLRKVPLASLNRKANNILPVIVTLTSIPSRLKTLDVTIRSILTGTAKPEKIILWLHSDLKGLVPKRLTDLINTTFEIKYQEGLTSSHRKLIYSLKAFPESTLVTCDDDLIYPSDWLESLNEEHIKHPKSIIANECRIISYDANGNLLPYKMWSGVEKGIADKNLLPIGYAGVLYPANTLHGDTINQELFLKLTPKADDLWFKMMSLLNNTEMRRSSSPTTKPLPIIGSQKISLKKENVRGDKNRSQWEALCQYYSQ